MNVLITPGKFPKLIQTANPSDCSPQIWILFSKCKNGYHSIAFSFSRMFV